MMPRKTEFWRSSTPQSLGPGSYTAETVKKVKQNKTAFLIKAKRQLSNLKQSSRYTPGPGYYSINNSWSSSSNQETSAFVSKSKREIFDVSYPLNPGPGSYESDPRPVSPSRKKPKFSAVCLDPTSVSIPSRDKATIVKTASMPPKQPSKGTSFGKYKSNRKVFTTDSSNPGPGSYDLDPLAAHYTNKKYKTCSGWMFNSNSYRPDPSKSSSPGPGAYTVFSRSDNNGPCFGVASRDQPLTNDPYRPIQVGYSDVPAVGTYYSKEEIIKAQKLKIKLINGEVDPKTVPFNVKDKREVSWAHKEKIPGPGDYNLSPAKAIKESSPFGTFSSRFKKEKNEETPGPGSYDTQNAFTYRASPVFISQAPRFKNKADKTPDPYTGHQKWVKKQTRAQDVDIVNIKLIFDSSKPRFPEKNTVNSLGPGSYDYTRPFTVSSMPLSTTARFKGFGDYEPRTGTDQHLGPGCYNPAISAKKSFNMAKELNNEQFWI